MPGQLGPKHHQLHLFHPIHDSGLVDFYPILAQFWFGLQTFNVKLNPHNAFNLRFYKISGWISHFPRFIPIHALFVQLGQQSNSSNLILFSVLEILLTMHINSLIIPSWYVLMVLRFGRVPVGWHVRVFRIEDKNRLTAILQSFMNGICKCDVADQLIITSYHRKMVHFKFSARVCNAGRKRKTRNKTLNFFNISLFEMLW